MDKLNSVGVNQRFKDETLYTGRSLNPTGFGKGEAGYAAAVSAAHKREGSEIVYQNADGQWFTEEIGEGDSPDNTRALSEVDQNHIKLNPTLSNRQGMYHAQIIFKDSRPEFTTGISISEMSSLQKLTTGNTEVAKHLLHKGHVAILNPLSTASDLTVGMAVNTWQTLRNPQAMMASVSETYQNDKVEGVIQGVKVGASVAASVALVVGATIAVGNLSNRGFSFLNGMAMEKAFVAENANLFNPISFATRGEPYKALLSRAKLSAAIGRNLAQIGKVTTQVGKVASLTLLGATSVSLVKNQLDLAGTKTIAEFKQEVNSISQDAGSLAQSAISYGTQKLFQKLAEQAKKLYTETTVHRHVSPEHQAKMDALIDGWAKQISERAASEIPELKPENWKKLSMDQRFDAIKKLQKIVSEIQQTPAVVLHIDDEYGQGAFYSPKTNSITLGKELFETPSIEVANILVHEQFHSLQGYFIEVFKKNPAALESFWSEHADVWQENTSKYTLTAFNPEVKVLGKTVMSTFVVGDVYPSLSSHSDYAKQPLEIGAWRIGTATQTSLRSLMGSEE